MRVKAFMRNWTPNFITSLAIVAGVGLLQNGLVTNNLEWARGFAVVSIIFQVLDGLCADQLKVYHKLGDHLSWIAAVLGAGGIVGTLVKVGLWPWGVALAVAILMVALGIIRWWPGAWPWLKQVQRMLYPLTLAVTYFLGLIALAHLVETNWVGYTVTVVQTTIYAGGLVLVRQKRIVSWFRWQREPAPAAAADD